jgi:hypothetical protein
MIRRVTVFRRLGEARCARLRLVHSLLDPKAAAWDARPASQALLLVTIGGVG